ncbi:MAG: dephospho-CoA kinase, partial [Muribaculaceae bacterium]|nr:dephospho-CoA kinase [Muribaculaceae bacterium]
GVAFVETAILFESGLNASVDAEWRVESPLELRIERTMKRNNLTRQQVEARIASQSRQPENPPLPPRTILVNDLSTALLPQIRTALRALSLD